MKNPINIAIVGLGVIGGSFALALKQQKKYPVHLLGIDHDPDTLQAALTAGAIDEGETANKSILKRADVVILTLYPSGVVNFIKEHRAAFKTGALLTDTTGVKGDIIAEVLPHLPAEVDFVFGHPMAGKESQGFAYADAASFQGANYLLTPLPQNQTTNIEFLTDLFHVLGFKRVRQVEAQVHDEMIAFVSQLCHVIAVSLINSDQEGRDTAAFVGDTYRELTRIAKINAPLWSELFLYNKEELLNAMTDFQNQFALMKGAIEADDDAALISLFEKATERRIDLEQTDQKLRSGAN